MVAILDAITKAASLAPALDQLATNGIASSADLDDIWPDMLRKIRTRHPPSTHLTGILVCQHCEPELDSTMFCANNQVQIAGFPWGDRSAALTNPFEQSPTTGKCQRPRPQRQDLSLAGVVRNYEFTIARGNIAPDGVNKSVILINGQFPGPTIEANWGDTFSIKVNNAISGPEEGTGVHWHGILHRQTPWYDGVPSVHQCPIPPGKSADSQLSLVFGMLIRKQANPSRTLSKLIFTAHRGTTRITRASTRAACSAP